MDAERFVLREELGRGAMGVVHRALDRETGIDLALKRLHGSGPAQASALRQEFRSLADVQHENLVELYELFAAAGESFFTMELVPGSGLVPHLRGGRDVVSALLQLVDGLAAIHAAGKLHRDVKPSNVLVTAEGRVVLLDFGLATAVGGSGQGELRGTPRYMAPELLWGRAATPAADWYALGAVLHEAFDGDPPFGGEPAGMLEAKMRGLAPPVLPMCPREMAEPLRALVRGMLDPEPERRPDAHAVRRLLEALRQRRRLTPVPAAPTTHADHAIAFEGRDQELGRLARCLASARERLVVAVVRGVSGIGKTELLRRFVVDARVAGALVLTGRCHPQETVPYRGFDDLVDGFGRLLVAEGLGAPAALTPAQAGPLLHVFPVLGQVDALARAAAAQPPVADVQELRRQAFAALRVLMRRFAGARPLVLWIDDVQWSDADGAALLRELVAAREPMLVVLSSRTEVPEPPALLEACDGPELVDVHPLDPLAARRLVRRVVPTATDEAVEALAAEAGGVPFLIMQLAGLPDDDGRPVRVADAVRRRVDALPEPARRLLATIAIASSPLDRTVALEASGLGEAGRPVVAALHRRRLLRLGGVRRAIVETYHDRIRETVAGGLEPATRARHHRALAVACEARDGFEPAWLAEQWLGAGDADRASVWATVAGDRAGEALAFAEAARLYRAARTWARMTEGRAVALLVKEGTALVNAGRCAEAAPCFLAAADRSSRAEAVELRRRAAEQFLGAGELDRANEILRPLFREIGLVFPRSPTDALARSVGWLAHHWVRSATRSRAVRAATARDRVRIDACYSGSRSLASIEPPFGIYLALRGLALAREVDDRAREGRMLVLVGAALRSLDGAVGRWGRRFMEEAEVLAGATGDPYLNGIVASAMAQAHLVTGQWRDAVDCADRGVRLLTERCRGVSAECAVGRMAALRACEELGAIAELRARAAAMLAAARDAGDRYAEVTAALNVAFGRLADGDPSGARRATREALGRWTQRAFNLHHLYAARIEAMCDLYDGDARAAAGRLAAIARPLRRSGLTRVPLPRVDAAVLGARIALAAGTEGVARTGARRLAREGRADATAHAIAIGAALAQRRGESGRAAEAYRRAAAAYRSAGMEVYASCADRRRGEALGDAAAVRAADDRLRTLGIADPVRWASVYVPVTPSG
ncbi:MAG: protein kinase [bacterium]|nr:protein kinase [bacterium]